jgi:hypothetical protein
MQTKICNKCKEEKEISEFYKQKRGKFGVSSICILCEKSPSARRDFLVPKGFKLCKVCDKEKSLSEFYKDKNCGDGFDSICKICDKEKYRESRKITRKKYKKQDINRTLQREYGITLNDYNKILSEQSNVCAICGQPESRKNQFGVIRLAVDHDHQTGKVRGLLCNRCNRAIGLFSDNFLIINEASNYLRKHNE